MTQDSETLAYDLLLCLFSPKYYKFLLFTIIFHVFKNLFSTHCLTVTKSNSLSVCQSFLTDHWQSLESAHKLHSPHTAYMGQLFTATFLKCVSSLDFSLRAAWAGHYALWREDCTALHSWRMTDIIGKLENSSFKVI